MYFPEKNGFGKACGNHLSLKQKINKFLINRYDLINPLEFVHALDYFCD